jgi:hypothetical protein
MEGIGCEGVEWIHLSGNNVSLLRVLVFPGSSLDPKVVITEVFFVTYLNSAGQLPL